jgi:antibiotic biosynthesis monooxygenase (ABM) superfamily enzyme
VSFATINFCIACQQVAATVAAAAAAVVVVVVVVVVVYYFIISLVTQPGNFWIHPHMVCTHSILYLIV